MKKNLIALAILAVSGIASAQSNVTLSGRIDAYVGSKKANGVTNTVVNDGGIGGSEWAISGSEDLGGGLKANFKLNSSFGSDNGVVGSPFFGTAYVGFSGGFGDVKLGKVGTAEDDVAGMANSAFDSSFSPAGNVWGNSFKASPGNTIKYSSPDMSGFSAAVSYSLNENKSVGVSAGNSVSFNVKYANGPLAVALASQSDKEFGSVSADSATRLLGTYDLGVAKLFAGLGKGDKKSTGVKSTDAQFGVEFPISNVLAVSGGFAMSTDKEADKADVKRSGFGIVGKYSLSKRTFVYTGLNSNKTKGSDNNNSLFGVGVQHSF